MHLLFFPLSFFIDKVLHEQPKEHVFEQFDGGLHQPSCSKHVKVMTFLEMNAKGF